MGKNNLVIVLGIVLAICIAFTIILYIQNNNSKLEISRLFQENNNLVQQNEQLNSDLKSAFNNLDRLQKDVEQIYKSCPVGNVCTGHFPLISWNCNNVGDLAEENASHICFCDSSCKLNATQITK